MTDYIIVFDACSIVILLVLFFSLYLRKMVRGRTNVLFIIFSLTILISAIADIGTVLFPAHASPSEKNIAINYAIDYLYFFTRNMTMPIYVLFLISVSGMWHEFKNNTIQKFIWSVPVSIINGTILVDIFSHNIFYIAADLQYYRGPWLKVLYFSAAFVILYSMFFIFKYREMVDNSKFFILFSVVPVSITGIIIQLFFPKVLIEIFTTTVPMLLISLIVQRPEEIINFETGCLNYFACIDEFQRNFKLKRDMLSIFININNAKKIKQQIGNENYRGLLNQIIKELYQNATDDENELYYLDNSTFVIATQQIDSKRTDQTAQEICNLLNKKHSINKIDVYLQTKICIVRCPQDLSDLTGVINFANTFASNIVVTNMVTYLQAEANSKEFKIKSEIDEIIKRGISQHRFKVYYQPIYDVNYHRFTSAEALIRLFDEKYGYISPALFIPAAEKNGAIHQIGDYVLENVCNFISSNNLEKLGLEYLEVNLSVAQCIEKNFGNKIIDVLKKYRIKPHQINFEITETSEEFNPEVFDTNIELLSRNGISFSLDDYGTGYSNIKRVTTLPLNIIKLDKCFVDEYQNEEVRVVVQNTVKMLKKLEKHILVEGIETESKLNTFIELGCDFIQGFYFSKPIPEKDFIMFLINKNGQKENV